MEKGAIIKIAYVGRLETGEIFDVTDEAVARQHHIYNPRARYTPLAVVVGAGFVIPGLDKALQGMNVGEKKVVVVEPAEGFGLRDAAMVKVFPKRYFEDPQRGKFVEIEGTIGRIQSVAAGRVTIDFNNPLAGKRLLYDLEVIEKIDGPEQQAGALLEFFGADGAAVRFDNDVAVVAAKPLPPQTKERASRAIIEHVKREPAIAKVRFEEEYSSKPSVA